MEWSGVLFYKVSGTFEEGIVFTPMSILLMDIGTQGYTTYNESPEIIGYIVDNPELAESNVFQGLIHSHNVMSAFFSGTDLSTLESEGNDRNHFLSLVVNNDGNYVARVTRKSNIKEHTLSKVMYNTYNNAHVELPVQSFDREHCIIEWFDVDIEASSSYPEFAERIKAIEDEKRKKKVITSPYNCNNIYSRYYDEYDETPMMPEPTKLATMPVNLPKKAEIPVSLEADNEKIIRDSAQYIVKQLLTGSICIADDNDFSVDVFIKGINTRFKNRFSSNIGRYTEFVSTMVDYIINDWIEENENDLLYNNPELFEFLLSTIDNLLKADKDNKFISIILSKIDAYYGYYFPEEIKDPEDLKTDIENGK